MLVMKMRTCLNKASIFCQWIAPTFIMITINIMSIEEAIKTTVALLTPTTKKSQFRRIEKRMSLTHRVNQREGCMATIRWKQAPAKEIDQREKTPGYWKSTHRCKE